jgi:3-oxoacyl-[acyl-carrier protein] reductase
MENRTVLITGGARGIGAVLVRKFAKNGDKVWFADLGEENVSQAEEAFRSEGLDCTGRSCNVADFSEVKELIEDMVKTVGGIDVLVNNAGITRDQLLMRMKEEQWDSVIDVNLKGSFNTIRHAVKSMMKKRSGCVINISSVVGVTGNPGQVNYTAAKAGVIGMTKTLARELASRGIRVNAVAPGYIETDMAAAINEKAREALMASIPLVRAGTADDVADVVDFLASDAASYMTGQVLHVDGGMYM